MRHRMWLALVGLVVVAGCTGTAPGASQAPPTAPGVSQAPPTATVTKVSAAPSGTNGQAADKVDMCALISLGDVQARSPFTRALVTARHPDTGGSPGTCRYESAITDLGTSIMMTVTTYPRPADAVAVLQAQGRDYADLGAPPQAIAGLGDAAFGIPRPEEAGVWAAAGSHVMDAILRGEWLAGDVPDVPLATKFAAGTELLKLVIARLP